MKASSAFMIAALIASAPASAADARETKAKSNEAKLAQKSGNAGNFFADTRKFLAEKSAKTAEVIKGNVERLRKKVASEPEPPPEKNKAKDKKIAQAKDRPAK